MPLSLSTPYSLLSPKAMSACLTKASVEYFDLPPTAVRCADDLPLPFPLASSSSSPPPPPFHCMDIVWT